MPALANPKCMRAGEGRTHTVLGGDVVCFKVTGDDCEGAYALCETTVPPGGGPPPHVHHREDETFYVIEGEFEFYAKGETIKAEAGSLVIAPRDIPHTFKNVGSTPGKMLILVRPAGFENFIAEFATLPYDQPPDVAKMAAIAAKYGLEFLV